MQNDGLDESQAGIRWTEKVSKTSNMQMIPTQWQKAREDREPEAECNRGE